MSCLPCPICFNPLPSPKRGEIDDRSRAGQHARYVSIRSPHRSEGRSASTRAIRLASGEFQSAPLTEARGDLRASWNYSFPFTRSFNPLPSPKRGEIQHQQQDRAARYGFNPLPSPKRGEILDARGLLSDLGLFQSAPLTEARGDPVEPTSSASRSVFQSAPLTEAREMPTAHMICAYSKFQSAPLTEARGDRCCLQLRSRTRGFNPLPSPKRGEIAVPLLGRSRLQVSIRSPHRSEGRSLMREDCSVIWACFNPLPSPKRGEMRRQLRRRALCVCFNPLPSPKRGEMCTNGPVGKYRKAFQSAPLTEARGDALSRTLRPFLWKCFNPLPSPKRGEIWVCELTGYFQRGFNPLPSPKRGEILHPGYHRESQRFQSAPLTEARGDPDGLLYVPFFGFVSIRSPHRSEGRFQPHGEYQSRRHGFNPLPSPKRGEICITFDMALRCMFQSAPLTEARGDRSARRRLPSRARFNPLPSPKRGRCALSPLAMANRACFNPLPSPKRGEIGRFHQSCDPSPVSIRSPHRSEGRWIPPLSDSPPLGFQSAPLTEARGDLLLGRLL